MSPPVGRTAGSSDRRLIGVDAARGLALLGMMAAHLLDLEAPGGGMAVTNELIQGRPSATFALLAGVGLALADGGSRGPDTPFRQMVTRTAVRAGVILLIGLLLAGLSPAVAVILQYYALLFLLVAPLLRLPAPLLVALAALWLAVGPVASHLLRSSAGLVGPNRQVDLLSVLTDPVGAVVELTLTGYYPVLTWFGYVLLGCAVGRLPLQRLRVAGALAVSGGVLTVGAALTSAALLRAGGSAALGTAVDAATGRSPQGPFYGTAPTGSWWWLAVDLPHSGTPPDLLGTAGSALLVLGACLLLARTVVRLALLPLAAAGTMTLTLYTAHVLAVTVGLPPLGPGASWWVHAVIALTFATLWRARHARGPLEAATAAVIDSVAGPRRHAGTSRAAASPGRP